MPRFDLNDADDPAARAISNLLTVPAAADELGALFAAAGHELYLVGGSVRDALLGVSPSDTPDLDFATDARPEQVLEIVRGWAEGIWEVGIAFGTVGLLRRNVRFEVTDGKNTVTIDHTGDPPDLFKEGAPVVCEGHWASSASNAAFQSDRILIKHGADYEPPKVDTSKSGQQ